MEHDKFLLANLILWYDFEIFRHKVNIAVINLHLRFLRWRRKKLNKAKERGDNHG
jgi:hypothetical protein